MEIIYPNITDYYKRNEVDIKITTTSADLTDLITQTSGYLALQGTHSHIGVSGIAITQSGNTYISSGHDLRYNFVGDGGQISTALSGHTWSITFSGRNNSLGWNYFSWPSGTLITHYLGNLNHTTHITPGGNDSLTLDEIAGIGDIYVDRGLSQDRVYTTGSGSEGIGFSWYAVISGTYGVYTAPDPVRLPCAYCTGDNLKVDGNIIADNFQQTNGSYGLPAPDYIPPNIKYSHPSGIYIPRGDYFAFGPRVEQQYLDGVNLGSSWKITNGTTINIDSSIMGDKINDSWYTIYLTGAGIIKILPIIRVCAVTYNTPYVNKTTINPSEHDDATTYQDGFISTHDSYNNYRLYKVMISGTTGGYELPIEGTVHATHDEIVVDGTQVSGNGADLTQGDYLIMAPPVTVPSLYLGSIRLDNSYNILPFTKSGWVYNWHERKSVECNLSTAPGNTYVGTYNPPHAYRSFGTLWNYFSGNDARYLQNRLYYGDHGSTIIKEYNSGQTSYNFSNTRFTWDLDWVFSVVSYIRNDAIRNYGSNYAATESYFYFTGFEE